MVFAGLTGGAVGCRSLFVFSELGHEVVAPIAADDSSGNIGESRRCLVCWERLRTQPRWRAQIAGETWVGVGKDVAYVRRRGKIPFFQDFAAEGQGYCTRKHTAGVFDLGDVPSTDVAVETSGIGEHGFCIGDTRHVPIG